MVGEVTSRTHHAYRPPRTLQDGYVNSATVHVRLCQFSNYFTEKSSSFFVKLGKFDKEVIITGREF